MRFNECAPYRAGGQELCFGNDMLESNQPVHTRRGCRTETLEGPFGHRSGMNGFRHGDSRLMTT